MAKKHTANDIGSEYPRTTRLTKIEDYILPVLTETGYELFDLELVKEGANWFLRIFIDKTDPSGITIDDCELVSRKVEKVLDEKDPIQHAYILEVSSPGIDRPLKKDSDYEKYKGSLVDIKLYKSLEGKKLYQGLLEGLVEDKIIITANDQTLQFKKSEVAQCRLAVVF